MGPQAEDWGGGAGGLCRRPSTDGVLPTAGRKSPKAGQGGALALQLLALPPRSQVGPGARHCNALRAPLPPLLWQERQWWLGQEETLLSHQPAPARSLEGARTGSTPAEKSLT